MKTSQIRAPLLEAQEIFAAAGAVAAAKDIGELLTLVDESADVDYEQFLATVRSKLDPESVKGPLRAHYLTLLRDAKLDEVAFKAAFALLSADTKLDKADVLAIAKDYGVIRIAGKSKASYLDSIERYFYWVLYNHDANQMAKRATPW